MLTLLQYLTNCVDEAFKSIGFFNVEVSVMVSGRPDLCQFQCNSSFAAGKKYKKSPLEIAKQVSKELIRNGIFKSVEAFCPGFINITLEDEFLMDYLFDMYNDANRGMPTTLESETILIDYGGPNIAKPLHIGHLRSAIIGESLKRIFRYAGYKVVGDVHLGDWGLPMGLIIAEMQERHPEWEVFSNQSNCYNNNELPEINVDELNEIYPYASSKSNSDEAFLKKAKDITFKLQNREKRYYLLWSKIREASISDLKKIYKELYVDFDLWNGESDSDEFVTELFNILKQSNLLYESQGALVVDVEQEGDKKPIPPIIVKKSDSSILYATTDLATLIQRKKTYNPKQIWYVVDSRQELHFEQVFRCAKKAGIVSQEVNLELLGFGTMNGADGRPFKTRDGGVMRLETLLELCQKKALEQISQSENLRVDSSCEKEELAKRISVAAIKFGDLINHRSKNYVFDINKFSSFEGKTGPYILYSLTRINSIFRKINCRLEKAKKYSSILSSVERDLVLSLVLSGDAFKQTILNKAPNILCEHLYGISNTYSKFYQTCNIINESNAIRKRNLLSLTEITKEYILLFLELLGIEPVDQM